MSFKTNSKKLTSNSNPKQNQNLSESPAVESGSYLALGHRPAVQLSPQDVALFRAFQSNLLSLISHELRTPLMGILNALHFLDGKEGGSEYSSTEWIAMAQNNAARLQQTLSTLLDIAHLESGLFHARLREVNLIRLIESAVKAVQDWNQSFLEIKIEKPSRKEKGTSEKLILADPQKLRRAIDLCLQGILLRADPQAKMIIRISSSRLNFIFNVEKNKEQAWDQVWSESLAGFKGGVLSPGSAFSGTLQSEQAFLSRTEEGLGSEFLLVHEIARLHQGTLEARRNGRTVQLTLMIPELSSEKGLLAVLSSRAQLLAPEQGGVSSLVLGLIALPRGQKIEKFSNALQKALFRSSDGVYTLLSRSQVALVLDDFNPQNAPKLLRRLEKVLGHKLYYGISSCPQDSLDPKELVDIAAKRMGKLR